MEAAPRSRSTSEAVRPAESAPKSLNSSVEVYDLSVARPNACSADSVLVHNKSR